jgi:hypothetical protein
MLPQEEECPVADSLLGTLYRSSPAGLRELVDTISTFNRAVLAVYCYRREHLRPLGLAIASSCDEDDLVAVAGMLGAAIFMQSGVVEPAKTSKITLSHETLRYFERDLV